MGASKMKPLMTAQEVARILNCSQRTVYRLLSDGQLEGGKVKGAIRIVPDSVDRYIERIVSAFQLENGPYRFEKNCD